jgi:hypothetical protein
MTMTLPSRLEIVKAFADPSRELRRSHPVKPWTGR